VTHRTRRFVAVAAVVVLLVLSLTTPVSAQQEYSCFTQAIKCFERAAQQSFWSGFWAALDCELTLVNCLREAILGY
jgi:hypothetical protein